MRVQLAMVYLKQWRTAEALVEAEKSVELAKRYSGPLGLLGYVYAKTGKRNEALAIIEDLEQRYSNGEANGYDLARTYAGLDEKDQAFAWLEKDLESQNATMPGYLNLLPLSSLANDPRFANLQKRMGLPE
jgi:tetratricopeptide (TPR) repeat protein